MASVVHNGSNGSNGTATPGLVHCSLTTFSDHQLEVIASLRASISFVGFVVCLVMMWKLRFCCSREQRLVLYLTSATSFYLLLYVVQVVVAFKSAEEEFDIACIIINSYNYVW